MCAREHNSAQSGLISSLRRGNLPSQEAKKEQQVTVTSVNPARNTSCLNLFNRMKFALPKYEGGHDMGPRLNTCYSNVDSALLSPTFCQSAVSYLQHHLMLNHCWWRTDLSSVLTAVYGPTFDPSSPPPPSRHALYCRGDFRRPLLMTFPGILGKWPLSGLRQWVRLTQGGTHPWEQTCPPLAASVDVRSC